MSPVRCRLSTSMGTTWLYPPPAAPPLMPNVGPIEGCLIATVACFPMCLNPCPRPTVVVVLPSPSGVGVIALTTTYLAAGWPASSAMASSLIFMTSSPCGSSRLLAMPMASAMSSSGFRAAARAISRSLGKAMMSLFSGGSDARRAEPVDADAERLARGGQRAEQVLARRPLAVQQVRGHRGPVGHDVVADDVGGDAGHRGAQRGPVRGHVVIQVRPAQPGQQAGR